MARWFPFGGRRAEEKVDRAVGIGDDRIPRRSVRLDAGIDEAARLVVVDGDRLELRDRHVLRHGKAIRLATVEATRRQSPSRPRDRPAPRRRPAPSSPPTRRLPRRTSSSVRRVRCGGGPLDSSRRASTIFPIPSPGQIFAPVNRFLEAIALAIASPAAAASERIFCCLGLGTNGFPFSIPSGLAGPLDVEIVEELLDGGRSWIAMIELECAEPRCHAACGGEMSVRCQGSVPDKVTVIVPGRHGALAGQAAESGWKKCTFPPADRSILPHLGQGDELAAIGGRNGVPAPLVPKAGRMPWL